MVKAPPWLRIGGKGARERAGGELPSWYSRKEKRPRVVRQEPDGATIEAVARMLASGTKSASNGARRGAVAVVRMLMGRGIKPSVLPRALVDAARADSRRDDTRWVATRRWLITAVGVPYSAWAMGRAWARRWPEDMAKRRTVAKGRAKGEA